MERPKLEVADVFRRYGEAYRQQHGASLSTAPRRVRHALEVCRTAALGGPVEQCEQCSHERIRYNSCRDRHCPKCPSLARAEWIQDRPSELLDTPYFPVVFPLPEQIAVIAYQNKDTGAGYNPHRLGYECRGLVQLIFSPAVAARTFLPLLGVSRAATAGLKILCVRPTGLIRKRC